MGPSDLTEAIENQTEQMAATAEEDRKLRIEDRRLTRVMVLAIVVSAVAALGSTGLLAYQVLVG